MHTHTCKHTHLGIKALIWPCLTQHRKEWQRVSQGEERGVEGWGSMLAERQRKWSWLRWNGKSWDLCSYPLDGELQTECTVWSKQTNEERDEERWGHDAVSYEWAWWSKRGTCSLILLIMFLKHHQRETNDWHPDTKINQGIHHLHSKRHTSGFNTS